MNCSTDCAAGAQAQFHLERSIRLVEALAQLSVLRHQADTLATSLRVLKTELGHAAAALKPRPYVTMTARLGGAMPFSAAFRILDANANGQEDLGALAGIIREAFTFLNTGEALGIAHAWVELREEAAHGTR